MRIRDHKATALIFTSGLARLPAPSQKMTLGLRHENTCIVRKLGFDSSSPFPWKDLPTRTDRPRTSPTEVLFFGDPQLTINSRPSEASSFFRCAAIWHLPVNLRYIGSPLSPSPAAWPGLFDDDTCPRILSSSVLHSLSRLILIFASDVLITATLRDHILRRHATLTDMPVIRRGAEDAEENRIWSAEGAPPRPDLTTVG